MDEKKIVDLAEAIKNRELQSRQQTPKAKLVNLLEHAEIAIAIALSEINETYPVDADALRIALSHIRNARNTKVSCTNSRKLPISPAI